MSRITYLAIAGIEPTHGAFLCNEYSGIKAAAVAYLKLTSSANYYRVFRRRKGICASAVCATGICSIPASIRHVGLAMSCRLPSLSVVHYHIVEVCSKEAVISPNRDAVLDVPLHRPRLHCVVRLGQDVFCTSISFLTAPSRECR